MSSGLRKQLGISLLVVALVALAACGGGGGSSSGGGDGAGAAKNGAPAPDGAVATRMQPQLNGWAFPNFPSATFPDLNFDTADLVSMFGSGPAVCVDGVAEPCTLTAEAAAWARMVNQARATGHCEGLVALASARFNKAELPETVKLPSQEEEIRAVMRAFATQFVPEVQESIQKWTKASLAEKVDELKRSFATDKLQYTLGVYVESGGHAVLPYAIEYPTPDIARIMVYDSNWPGRNRYVDVDLANDEWSFSFAGDDPAADPNIWSGGAGDMDLTPFEAREGTCPFCGDDTKVQSTTMLVRTDNLDWSVETPAGAVSPTQATNGDGAAARPVKGSVVITRLSPRTTDRSSYDFMITIPNDVLENGAATNALADSNSSSVVSPTRFDAFISDGQGPKVVTPTTSTVPASTTTVPSSGGSRAKLLFGGAASVFAVTPGGVAQFSTPGSKDKPVEVGARSIKSSDPNVDLTLASGNLVANASGPSVELGASDEGTLAVAVTTATGEVIQQEVTPEAPAVQVKADETGGVTVLEASSTGEVTKTEVAADGTKTETVVDASELNLNKVEIELPPALESKAIEALPKLEDRNLNNPNYKADEAYTPPTTTVPSAAGAKETAGGSTTTPAKASTPSTVATRNAALPSATTLPRSVSAAGATPTTIASVVKPSLTNFRIETKTFGDPAFTVDPPDSDSPGGFRYSSSRTEVASINATTGRVTIVGAGISVITATQAAARGFEAGTITATLIVGKATPENSVIKDITKTFGDEPFTIARPTSNSTGSFTFTSSDDDVIKQSRTTGRWVIGGAGKATITVSQASTDDFTSTTESFVVTVRKGTPEITAPADVSKAFLDADFDLPKPTSPSKGVFAYSSSDSNILSITGTKATINAAGTVTITASQAGNTDWVAASTTFKVVVASTAPTLTEFADVTKTFGDAAFDLTTPKSNSSGAITYKSSDDKVVTVGESDGKVSIIGAGSATITASQAATSGFSSGSITSKITIAKASPALSDLLVGDKAFGDTAFTLKPTSKSTGAITYSTDKASVFAVDATTGVVRIVGVGTATLTAKQAASANYEAGSSSVSVSVKKGTPTYSWTLASKTFGDSAFDVTAPTSTSTGAITYTSSDTTVASITSAGRVTVLKAGTTTITALQVTTDTWLAATTTATLTVDKLAPTLTGFTIPTKTFGDAAFSLTAPTSNSTGAFRYEIVAGSESNSNVATVTTLGVVTVGQAGTVQIRATQDTTSNYATGSIVATLTVQRATQQGISATGLVAKWSFDSADTLGANSTGTGNLVGSGGPTWSASGKFGGALSLNGSAYLALAQGSTIAGLPIGNSTYTQTAWFNASALGGRGIIGWGSYGSSQRVTALRLFGDAGGFRHYWWGNDLDSGVTLNTGRWYHVAATFDGTTRRIYLDGQMLVSDQPTGHNATAEKFAVGATNNFGERFSGLLDDVAIYNRALTADEVAQLAVGSGSDVTVTSTTGAFGTPLTLATNGGQGAGAVTFQLISAGTAGCSLVGSVLTSTSGGTCTVKATKAADRNYEAATSIDTTITFDRIAQTTPITISTITATAGIDLALAASGGTGTGAFSYTIVSAGTAICTINGTSLVTTSNGTCTITATRAADSDYTASTSATTTISVSRQNPTIAPYTITDRYFGGAAFTLTAPSSTGNGTFSWASSNTSVASVNASTGVVSITGIGTTTITATQAQTAMFNSAATTAELTILPTIPTIGTLTVPAKTFGDPAFTISQPTTNSPGAFTYTSSDPSVATIDSATRTITILSPGLTTITATQAASGSYGDGSVAAVLNVNRITPTFTSFGSDSGSGPGLKGTRYVGYFNDNVDWFATATKQGQTNQITDFTNFTSSADGYSWEWTGSFKASTTGTYTFCTNSDDASYLWLGAVAKTGFTTGNALVNNGGLHGMREICATTTLSSGASYPIRIQFGENGGGDAIIVRFVPPGGSNTYNGVGYYFGGMGITKAEGDASFTPTLPTSDSPASITYSSSDTSVATIDETTGLVTVVGRGTATLTASQAATANYAAASTTTEIRVLRRATVGTFTIPPKTFASPAFTPTAPTSDSPGAWSYESSNTAVARWDAATNLITVASAGTATVTAVQAETGEFAESRVSTTVTIEGETVTSIESSERQSCAITAQGGVVCWGQNNYGQLGDGTRTNRAYPVSVSGISSGAVKLAMNLWHTCAVMADGTVKCWGRNSWGELGNNSTSDSNVPVTVSGITDAIDIAVSGYATCVGHASGGVSCWGYGGHGELGNTTGASSLLPVRIASISARVTSISADDQTYCATTEDGAAQCWGRNDWGNLGDGTTTRRFAPVEVIGLNSGATKIAVSTHTTCAVTGSGGVMCWGYGGNGQNGNGTTNQYQLPVAVTGITDAIDIDGGHQHFCARLSSGQLKCWGWNGYGQLGTGNTSNASTPVTVADVSGVRDVSTAYYHTCALSTEGTVQCWGYNGDSQLGDKTTTSRYAPGGVAGIKAPVISEAETQLAAVSLSTQRFRVGDTTATFSEAVSNRS
ncbi:MAG: Ig-like domain-containing protein, partial [Ilumatobacteraceae bacterium]